MNLIKKCFIVISIISTAVISNGFKGNVLNEKVKVESPTYYGDFDEQVLNMEDFELHTIVVQVMFDDSYFDVNASNMDKGVLDEIINDEQEYYVSLYLNLMHVYFKEIDDALDYANDVAEFSIVKEVNVMQNYSIELGIFPPNDDIVFDDGSENGVSEPVDCKTSYTNDRVKIGIVDSGNIVRSTSDELCDLPIIEEYPDKETNSNEHITLISEIILNEFGNTNDFALFTTITEHEDNLDLLPRMEWLIAQDVDVISLSIGTANIGLVGMYTELSSTVDMLARATKTPIVAAVGQKLPNWPLSYVVSPGNGYNVFGIGGVEVDYTAYGSTSNYEITTAAFEISKLYANNKPNVVDTNNAISVAKYGTSFSTPRVASTIAKYIMNNPSANNSPEVLFGVMQNTAYRNTILYNPSSLGGTEYRRDAHGLDDIIGAGIVSNTNINDSTTHIEIIESTEISSTYTFQYNKTKINAALTLYYMINDVDSQLVKYQVVVRNDATGTTVLKDTVINNLLIELPGDLGNYTITIKALTSIPHNGDNVYVIITEFGITRLD